MSIRGRGWIAVDFDGTTATFVGNGVQLGAPIPAMVERIKAWVARGRDVRIFTARVSHKDVKKKEANRKAIEAWCLKHIGTVLPVTNEKDFETTEIWDDKAVQVVRNTGLSIREVNSRNRRVTHTPLVGRLFNGR